MQHSKRLLVVLLVCNFVASSLNLNIVSLLPQFVDSHFPDKLSNLKIGVLMAVYPVAFLFATPIVGERMQSFGRKNALVAGVLLMTVATVVFGLAAFFTKVQWFYSVSFIARTLQGVAEAVIGCAIPSIVASEYADDRQELYIGYVEMSIGAGLCMGPLIGAIVYRYVSYTGTFVVFAGLILVFGLLTTFMIPQRLNNS